MQEKIEEVLRKHLRIEASGKALDALQVMQLTVAVMGKKEAAAEIVALIEREVIWEGEGEVYLDYVRDETRITFMSCGAWCGFTLFKELIDICDGQRVRVIVEDIDDNKPAD